MSRSVEERVVEMKFDNKQFESGIKTSMSTLEKFKSSLDLTGATKGLEEINRASENVDFSGIAAGIEALNDRFSTLGIIGMRVIQNLTDKVMEMSGKVLGFLTDGIVQGGISRAMKIEQAKFQLEGLKVVWDEISADISYGVKDTAYGLDSAAVAASQLVASGIEFGKVFGETGNSPMAKALRGISGVAAMTNSDYDSMARIFTTVAGNGRLMGDQLNQLGARGLNAAATLADFFNGVNDGSITASESVTEAVKVLSEDAQMTEETIRDLTSKGEISFGIFSEAMDSAFGQHAKDANRTFTGAMSNIRAALGRIGADFVTPIIETDSAVIKLFQSIIGKIDEFHAKTKPLAETGSMFVLSVAKRVTDLVEALDVDKTFEGFLNVLESTKNVLGVMKSMIAPVSRAFRDIFPPVTIDMLVKVTEQMKELTKGFKISEETSENLRRTFAGLFAVVDIVKDAFEAFFRAALPGLANGAGVLTYFGKGVVSVTAKVGDFLVSVRNFTKENQLFQAAMTELESAVVPVFHKVSDAITGAVSAIKEFVGVQFGALDMSGLDQFGEMVQKRVESFGGIGKFLKSVFDLVVDIFKSVVPVLKRLGGLLGDVFADIGRRLHEAFSGQGFDGLLDLANGGLLAGISVGIAAFIKNLMALENQAIGFFDLVKTFRWTDLGKNIQGVLFQAKNGLVAFQADMKAGVLKKLAEAIAILAGSLLVLSLIDSGKLAGSLTAMTGMFVELVAATKLLNPVFASGGLFGGSKLTQMAGAILLLAAALKIVSGIDTDKLAGALAGITVLIGELSGASIALSKWGGKIQTSAVGMILFATAINILSNALKKIGALDTEQLVKGLAGVGVLMAELAGFMAGAKFGNFKVMQGMAIIELAVALLILEKAVEGFGNLDLEVIKQGLITIGIILTEIAAFSIVAGKASHIMSTAIALAIIGGALLIFGKAIEKIGMIPFKIMVKGLSGIAVALAAVTLAVNFMPKNLLIIGLGLLEVAGALAIIGDVINKAGQMSWEQLGKGMLALGGAMAILAVSLNLLKGTIGAATAVFVVSAALAVMAPVLKSLGSMSIAEIGKALIVLAGAFAILGIAGAALSPMIPTILGLSAAFTLFGVAVAACGIGVLALATGLTALIGSGVAAAAAMVAIIRTLIVGVLKIIADSYDSLADALKTIVLATIDVLVDCAPAFVEGVLVLIEGILKALVEHIPVIITYLMDFLTGVLNALAEKVPELVVAAVNLLGQFFNSVMDALSALDTTKMVEGIAAVGIISALVVALANIVPFIPMAMVGTLGAGAIIAELALVFAALGALAQIPGLQWLIGEGGNLLQGVGAAIGKFFGGIVGGIAEGVTSQFPQMAQNLSDFMNNLQGFIDGAKKIDFSMLDGVQALAETILLLTGAEILQGIASWLTGGSNLADFGAEIAAFAPSLADFANAVAGVNSEQVKGAAEATKALAEMASAVPNEGGLVAMITGENSLAAFGEELEEFGPYLAAYSSQVEGINPEQVAGSVEATKLLAEMAASLPNSGGLVALITGDNSLAAFGVELDTFGPLLSKYAQDVADLDIDAVKGSAEATKLLAEMAVNLPNSGGLVALITCDNSLAAFGKELALFGPHLKKYATEIADINAVKVKGSAEATSVLAEMASNLPNTGGLVALITGDNSLAAFGVELADFGPSLKSFADKVKDIRPNLVEGAAEATQKLIEMAGQVPNSGGLVSCITGDNSLAAFGEELRDYGGGLAKFAEQVKDINAENVITAAEATSILAGMSTSLPSSGGLKSLISGENGLADFGEALGGFGENFADFAEDVSGLPANIVAISTNIAQSLQQFATGMPTTGGLAEKIFGEVDLESFGEVLKNFAPDFAEYAETVSGIEGTNVVVNTSSMTTALRDIADNLPASLSEWDLEGLGEKLKSFSKSFVNFAATLVLVEVGKLSNVITQLARLAEISEDISNINGAGLSELASSLREAAAESVTNFIQIFADGIVTVRQKAIAMMQAVIAGINSEKPKVINSVKMTCGNIITGFSDALPEKTFKGYGSTLIIGTIMDGMNSRNQTLLALAGSISQGILSKFRTNLSQSVFYNIGANIGIGLLNGINLIP